MIKTYGQALYTLSKEEGLERVIYNQLKSITTLLSENYIHILDSYAIEQKTRLNLIQLAFYKQVHVYVLNFLKLLAKHRLMYLFEKCVSEYEKQYFIDTNTERITVTSAIMLTDDEKARLYEVLSKKHKKNYIIEYKIRKEILGGIIIDFDGFRTDSSLKTKLSQLSQNLLKGLNT